MNTMQELEQALLSAWSMKDDLTLISEGIADGVLTVDKQLNLLIGFSELYDLKMDKIFMLYEKMFNETHTMCNFVTEITNSGETNVI